MKHVSFKCVPVSFYYSLKCIILTLLLFHLVFVKALFFANWTFGFCFCSCSFVYFFSFFCHYIFLIEGYLLYRILWFSVIHQQESAIGTPMSPPSQISLPSSSPSDPSRLTQSPCLSSLSHATNTHWLSILHMVM